jgi:hypothetical protein
MKNDAAAYIEERRLQLKEQLEAGEITQARFDDYMDAARTVVFHSDGPNSDGW